MLEMRVARRLLKSAGDDATLAYLCVLMPTKEEGSAEPPEQDTHQSEKGANTTPPSTVDPEPPPPEPPPAMTREQVTQQAMERLQRGISQATWTTLPAQASRSIQECLKTISQWDGKGSLPKAAETLIQEMEKMSQSQHSLGEDFWNGTNRRSIARLVEKEFQTLFREELPVKEGPEIDYSKPPAVLRFKEDYKGQTPHRS
eukprot:9468427-Pyramimonas_sp.AAC.1